MMIIIHILALPHLIQYYSSVLALLQCCQGRGGGGIKILCIFATYVWFNGCSLLGWPMDLNLFNFEGCLQPPKHLRMRVCQSFSEQVLPFQSHRTGFKCLLVILCSLWHCPPPMQSFWRILMLEVKIFVNCLHAKSIDICAFYPSSIPLCNTRQAACI